MDSNRPGLDWLNGGWLALLVCACLGAATVEAGTVRSGAEGAKLGTYQGAGCDGTRRLRSFKQWLGRDVDLVLEFLSWDALSKTRTWALNCWTKAGYKNLVLSIPMLPPGKVATLADGAAGRFDDVFERYGAELVKRGFSDAILRVGWEFNANWYAWAASKDPKAWVAYYRRIVAVLRAVPGARFKFDWNPAAGQGLLLAESVYPGDDVVDIIGLDFYNARVNRADRTPQQRWQSRMNMKNGLKWHRDFAMRHGKPMSYPEWGTGTKDDGTGGGDDPYFIEQMAHWIASNNVVYQSYWDYPARDFNARISKGELPQAGAAFQRLFGAGRTQ